MRTEAAGLIGPRLDSSNTLHLQRPTHVDEITWRFSSFEERTAMVDAHPTDADAQPRNGPCPLPDGTPCDIVVPGPPPPPRPPPGPPPPIILPPPPTSVPGTGPTVSGQVGNEANLAKVQQAKAKLEQVLAAHHAKINAIPDGTVIKLRDQSTVTGAEVKSAWNSATFTVTDKDYGPGRAGAVTGNNSSINATQFLGWDSHANGGIFIALHEVLHMTGPGRAADLANWNAHLASGGTERTYDANSPHFVANEQFANFGARAFTQAAGIGGFGVTPANPGGTLPTHGY